MEPPPRPLSGVHATQSHPASVVGAAAYSIIVVSCLWLAFTPVALEVTEHYQVSVSQYGVLVSGCFALTALFTPVLGRMADRTDARRLQIAMLSIAMAGSLLSAAAPSFLVFAIIRLLIGLSAATFVVSLRQALSVVAPERAGLVQGVIGMCFALGVASASLVVPALAGVVGWQLALGAPVVLGVPAIIWQTRIRAPVPERQRGARLPTVWRQPVVVAYAFGNFALFGGNLALVSFLPLFLAFQLGLSSQRAGPLAAAAIAASGTGRPLGGWIADTLGGARTLAAFMLTALVSLPVVHGDVSVPLTVTAAGVLVLAFNAAGAALYQVAARSAPIARQGGFLGAVAGAGVLGGMLLSSPYGYLVDRTGDFLASNVTVVVLGLAAAVLIWQTARSERKRTGPIAC